MKLPIIRNILDNNTNVEIESTLNVLENLIDARGLKEEDLKKAYKSQVDPRLNYEQAMEISFLIAEQLQQNS